MLNYKLLGTCTYDNSSHAWLSGSTIGMGILFLVFEYRVIFGAFVLTCMFLKHIQVKFGLIKNIN